MKTKTKCVAQSISDLSDKTSIPHDDWSGRKAVSRVERLIASVRNFKKNFKKKRDADIQVKFGQLFDIARCKCPSLCTCTLEDQVPFEWKKFLEDQRGERKLIGVINSRKLSLRGASAKRDEDRKRKVETDERRHQTTC